MSFLAKSVSADIVLDRLVPYMVRFDHCRHCWLFLLCFWLFRQPCFSVHITGWASLLMYGCTTGNITDYCLESILLSKCKREKNMYVLDKIGTCCFGDKFLTEFIPYTSGSTVLNWCFSQRFINPLPHVGALCDTSVHLSVCLSVYHLTCTQEMTTQTWSWRNSLLIQVIVSAHRSDTTETDAVLVETVGVVTHDDGHISCCEEWSNPNHCNVFVQHQNHSNQVMQATALI